MKPIAVVNYSEFTDHSPPADAFALLKQYPTDFLVLQLSKINGVLFNDPSKDFDAQLVILRSCFPNLSLEKRKRVAELFVKHKEEKDIAFFTAPTVSKLISLCLRDYTPMPEEDEPVNMQELEDRLLDSLLIQNELYYNRHPNSNLNAYEAIWHLQLLQQHYIRSHPDLLFIAPLKAFLFYKFVISRLPNGPKYVEEFCNDVGIPAYFNYPIWFREILQRIVESGQQEEAKHILELTAEQRSVVTLFSINKDRDWNNYIKGNVHGELMMHPFYLLMNNHAIIIDPHFFRYILDIGFPFQLYKHSSLSKEGPLKNFNNYKSELGKKYYEEFVVKGLLENIFKAKNYVVLDTMNDPQMSDFTVVRNQRQILMIEVKSATIHFNPLEDVNVEAFKSFVDEQFCRQKGGEERKNKGIYQLSRQIHDFATTSTLNRILKKPDDKNKAVIFPIIIYTDDVMDMAGVNAYVGEKIQDEVETVQQHFKTVHPLIMINLSFLLRYYAKLKQNPSLVFELFISYIKTIAERSKAFNKSKNPFLFFEKNISFDQYVAIRMKDVDFVPSFRELVADLHLIDHYSGKAG